MKDFPEFPDWYENKEIYGHYKCKENGEKYFATSYNDILGWYEYEISKGKKKENLTIFGKPIKEEKKIFFIGKISIYQGRVLVAKFDIHTHKYVFYSYGKEIFLEKFKKEEQRHERF